MLFFATQPKHTTPAIGVLGCEEQTKKILTKAEDFDPTAPFSSSTFRLGTPVKKDGALHLPYTHFNFPYPGWFSPEKHRHSFMDTGTTMEPMELIFDPTTWRAEARQIIPADCHHLVEHAEGDTKRLTMEDHLIEDVSGLFYVEGFVFFSASPIYGIPEIGVVQCSDLKRTRLLAARHITEAYPDGTDYFELKEVSKKEGAYEISYYYFPDVAAGDFSTFRTPPNLKVFNYRP